MRMRLLIVTQAVDTQDPVLGFFHRWIEEFSKHCQSVHVICLKEGRHSLPTNVEVYSLGKEHVSRISYLVSRIKYALRFYKYIWILRKEYDAVFVHMNPEYVLLGGKFWRLWGKKIGLWYVHRQHSLMLTIAGLFANIIFTSASGSIGLKNSKIKIVGHGIDTGRFSSVPMKAMNNSAPRIVSVGRITPIKSLETIINAVALLRAGGVPAKLDLIGSPVMEGDVAYEKNLHVLVEKNNAGGYVSFLGSIQNDKMPAVYAGYDVSINACPDGGIDKAVLESMAAGIPVLVSNKSFSDYLGKYAQDFTFAFADAENLAQRIRALLARTDVMEVKHVLRKGAEARADVGALIPVIIAAYGSGTKTNHNAGNQL